MNPFPLLLTLSLLGCYNPDLSGVHYTCDDKNPYCPDGLTCVGGVCRGKAGVDASGGVDGAGPPADMSPAPADMWGVQGPAVGCKSGTGYQISASAAACPGVFANDPSMSACAPGWSTCTQNPLPPSVCKQRMIFGAQACFIGAVRAQDRSNPTDSQSMIQSWAGADANSYRYILGCGACIGWADAAIQAGGFTNTMQCDQPVVDFQCPKSVPGKDSDFLKVSNKDPNGGVFCCKG